MNEAQISLADKISDSLKRLIASKLDSQYKGEAPYSGCCVQEGYFDFLGVECRRSRIRLYLHDFGADSFRADAPEIDELEREEFEAIVPLIAKSAEEEFLAEANLPFLRISWIWRSNLKARARAWRSAAASINFILKTLREKPS
ncbi:hypothetical protein [uncultured Campylobacter sp.]|uniref:hypothetical protein n=1 Tax=uncultured Campylobacter sp. TaxID=218934 RepID=UPI00260D41FE|nr:hypothetical protein [uncultured Campylobacter sp.]